MAALAGSCALAASCAHLEHSTTVHVAGDGQIRLTRLGENFAQSEDARYVVTESGLTTFRRGGRNFVRWQFTVRVKQPARLADINIDEVSGPSPVPILEDRAPRVDQTYWSKQSTLIPANRSASPWLYTPETTLRIFRVTVTDASGTRSVLYQPANFNRKAKEALLYQMGPEIPGT
ncbi:MAG: hypothetical protein JO069_02965 [Verrucomicrobia bacterium]|nr:hypothetical protein [Verrucomicrobiota bacterium]